MAPGWVRRCNLGSGDFNNDLTTSDTPGDVWSCLFTGTSVSVIAPKEAGAGKIEVQIDGETRATADLSTTGTRQAQQVVCEVTGLDFRQTFHQHRQSWPRAGGRGCLGDPVAANSGLLLADASTTFRAPGRSPLRGPPPSEGVGGPRRTAALACARVAVARAD